jgi:hypothetical protein
MKHLHFILSGLGVFISFISIASLITMIVAFLAYVLFITASCLFTHPALFLIAFVIPFFWVIGWFKAEKDRHHNP